MGKTYIADKETLDKCYAILSADGIYGFIEHMDVLSPTARIKYIGRISSIPSKLLLCSFGIMVCT